MTTFFKPLSLALLLSFGAAIVGVAVSGSGAVAKESTSAKKAQPAQKKASAAAPAKSSAPTKSTAQTKSATKSVTAAKKVRDKPAPKTAAAKPKPGSAQAKTKKGSSTKAATRRSTSKTKAVSSKAPPSRRATEERTDLAEAPSGGAVRVGNEITMLPNGVDSTSCRQYSMSSRGYGGLSATFYRTARGDFTTDRNEASCR